MRVIQSPAPLALQSGEPSVFMAGSIDMGTSIDWQQWLAEALAGSPGVLLNPRRVEWDATWVAEASSPNFRAQVEWELSAMEAAGMIAFYFAPASQAPVTLLELGLAARGRKAVVCCPPGYWRRGNVEVVCNYYDVPMVATLDALADGIRAYVGPA